MMRIIVTLMIMFYIPQKNMSEWKHSLLISSDLLLSAKYLTIICRIYIIFSRSVNVINDNNHIYTLQKVLRTF